MPAGVEFTPILFVIHLLRFKRRYTKKKKQKCANSYETFHQVFLLFFFRISFNMIALNDEVSVFGWKRAPQLNRNGR